MHSNLSFSVICFFGERVGHDVRRLYNHIFKAFKLNVRLLSWILTYPLKTNGLEDQISFGNDHFLGKRVHSRGSSSFNFFPAQTNEDWETAGEGHVEGTCWYKVRTFQDSSSREEASRIFCCWSFWQKLLVSKWSKFKVSSVNKQKSKKGWFGSNV